MSRAPLLIRVLSWTSFAFALAIVLALLGIVFIWHGGYINSHKVTPRVFIVGPAGILCGLTFLAAVAVGWGLRGGRRGARAGALAMVSIILSIQYVDGLSRGAIRMQELFKVVALVLLGWYLYSNDSVRDHFDRTLRQHGTNGG